MPATAKEERCDIGYVVKDFAKPLMQAMTMEVEDYHMRLITTKCLNTAVMFMVLFFGKDALNDTVYCDVDNVVRRHTYHSDNNRVILRALSNDLLRRTQSRYVFYLMLTDGYFIGPGGTKHFFPGHVMVWEKIPDESPDKMHYYIYQSYINQYDYKGSLAFRESPILSKGKITYYLQCLTAFAELPVWTKDMVDFWKDLTNVDTSEMLNAQPSNAFYVCYKKRPNKTCLQQLYKFVGQTLAKIPKSESNKIFGNSNKYDQNADPLTNHKMREAFTSLKEMLHHKLEHASGATSASK
jgi:glycosyltransferase involved in cell wall biosynthesis